MNPHPDDRVVAITTTPVVTVSARASLRDVARTLRTANVGLLVVLPESGAPLGVISERDVVRALADGADPDDMGAADVMSEEPRYATPGQTIRSVAQEMVASGVRHVPVMDDGQVVGMVAGRDALAVLAAAAPEEPVHVLVDDEARAVVERELAHPGG